MAYKPPFTRAPGGAPPAGPATLRRANFSLVLREHASLSRADIAQATGPASTLGFGAASRGAASMVINHIIDDPTTIMDLPRPASY
jgi:hypothetical protein